MEAVAHNPSFAKKVGIPQSVGKDFSNADKGKKFSKGGDTMATDPRKLAAMLAKKKAQMAQAQQAPAAPFGKAHRALTRANRHSALCPAALGRKRIDCNFALL